MRPAQTLEALFALGTYFGGNVAHQWCWLFFVGSLLLPEVAAEQGHPGGTASRRFSLPRCPRGGGVRVLVEDADAKGAVAILGVDR